MDGVSTSRTVRFSNVNGPNDARRVSNVMVDETVTDVEPMYKISRIAPVYVHSRSISMVDQQATFGRCDLDSHAGNSILGSEAVILEEYADKCTVFGYNKSDGGKDMHLAKVAVAYDVHPGKTFLLIFDQCFHDPT